MGTRYSYDIENLRMCAVVFTAEMALLIASPLSLFVTGMHLLFRLGGLLSITFVRNAPSERWQIHYYLLSTLPLWLPVLGLYVYQEDISYRSFVCFAAAQSSGRLLDVYFAALPRTNSLKLNTDEEWRTVHSWDIFQCVAHLFIVSDVRYGVILPNEEQGLSQRLRRFVRGLFGMLCAGLIPAVVLGGLLPLCPLSWQQSPILLFYLFLLNFPAVMHSLDPMYALYSTFGSVKFESVMDGTPFLTCTSLGDFWRRWNVPAQRNFHSYVYRPCRSHLKMSPTLALMVTFFASAFYHMVGIFLMGAPIRMVIAVGFFFIGESVGIVLERMLLPSFLRVVGPSRQYMWIWGYNALILPLFVLPWIL